MPTQTKENILITAASITAELSKVRKIAKEMSIGVMNAKAISHRAGETALGFRPITDFIDEMAREVTQLVQKISSGALELSRMAVERTHLEATAEKYRRVFDNAKDARHIDSLKPAMDKIQAEHKHYHEIFSRSINQLDELLDEIKNRTKGSQVLSATSRVEASRAMGFRANLEVVADNLEKATENIRKHVKISHSKLSDVLEYLKKEAA